MLTCCLSHIVYCSTYSIYMLPASLCVWVFQLSHCTFILSWAKKYARKRHTDRPRKRWTGVMLALMRALQRHLNVLPQVPFTFANVPYQPLVPLLIRSLAHDLGAEPTCWRSIRHRCNHRLPHGGASQVSLLLFLYFFYYIFAAKLCVPYIQELPVCHLFILWF